MIPRRPLIVIPARMASTRLPGKPLADIAGQPMIVHVWRRAVAADIGRVVVAAAEPEIADVIQAAGGEAVLTRPDHPSGSDRVMEAAGLVDPDGEHDVIVNLQGDLPTLPPGLLAEVMLPFSEPTGDGVDIATLVAEITDPAEAADENVVKVAVAFGDDRPVAQACWFSRAPIPAREGPLWHHIGIYAWQRPALARFVTLPPTLLEVREGLEQLRALEAGMRIDAVWVGAVPPGVDTPADLEVAKQILNTQNE